MFWVDCVNKNLRWEIWEKKRGEERGWFFSLLSFNFYSFFSSHLLSLLFFLFYYSLYFFTIFIRLYLSPFFLFVFGFLSLVLSSPFLLYTAEDFFNGLTILHQSSASIPLNQANKIYNWIILWTQNATSTSLNKLNISCFSFISFPEWNIMEFSKFF